jgi:hypothetical protein
VAAYDSSAEGDQLPGSPCVTARAPAQTRCPCLRLAKPARRCGDAAQVFARLAATPIRPTDESDLAVRVSAVCADQSGVATSMPLLWDLTQGAEELTQCVLSVVETEAAEDVARQRAHLRPRAASVSRERELTHR